jgi:hypothetical protein
LVSYHQHTWGNSEIGVGLDTGSRFSLYSSLETATCRASGAAVANSEIIPVCGTSLLTTLPHLGHVNNCLPFCIRSKYSSRFWRSNTQDSHRSPLKPSDKLYQDQNSINICQSHLLEDAPHGVCQSLLGKVTRTKSFVDSVRYFQNRPRA